MYIDAPNSAYNKIFQHVIENGIQIAPRNELTLESLNVSTIYHIGHRIRRPKLNSRIGIIEGLATLAGTDALPYLEVAAPKTFASGIFNYHSNYGLRCPDIYERIMHELVQDLGTRRACVYIGNNDTPSYDAPCTTTIQATVRQGRLNLHAHMRSLDIYRGLPVDLDIWNILGFALCGRLASMGVPIRPGRVCIHASSAHIYIDDLKIYNEHSDKFYEAPHRYEIHTPWTALRMLEEMDWSQDE